MFGAQLRAARALIGWTAQQLAEASGVGVATIRRAELKDGLTRMTGPNIATIERALAEAGVEMVVGDQPGVRLKQRP